MGSAEPDADIGWLVRQGDGEAVLPVSGLMTADDGYWRATIERIDVGPGIRVNLTRAIVHKPLTVEAANRDPGVWLMAHMSVRGHLSIRFPDGVGIEIDPERTAFFRPRDGRAALTPSPGRSLRLVGYMVREDRVRSMFGERLPEALRPILDGEDDRSHVLPVATGPAIRHLAASLFTNPLRGPLRQMFIEGVVLQFLALKAASPGMPAGSLSRRDRSRLQRARDSLLSDMRSPPDVAMLAADAGMSEAALNTGFRKLFGGTVYEVLRDQRLDHARIALETTEVPIKQIAHGVGYNHVTNFINAFTRRYGAPPHRYARGRSGSAAPVGETEAG